jgi:hypothetical protein
VLAASVLAAPVLAACILAACILAACGGPPAVPACEVLVKVRMGEYRTPAGGPIVAEAWIENAGPVTIVLPSGAAGVGGRAWFGLEIRGEAADGRVFLPAPPSGAPVPATPEHFRALAPGEGFAVTFGVGEFLEEAAPALHPRLTDQEGDYAIRVRVVGTHGRPPAGAYEAPIFAGVSAWARAAFEIGP